MRFTSKAARCYYKNTDGLRMAHLISKKDRQDHEHRVIELYRTVIIHPKLPLHSVQWNHTVNSSALNWSPEPVTFPFSQWNVHQDAVQGAVLHSCTFLLGLCGAKSLLKTQRTWCAARGSVCRQTGFTHTRYLLLERKELEKGQATYCPSHCFACKGPTNLTQSQGQIWCVCSQMTAG